MCFDPTSAIQELQKLKYVELYKFPAHIIESIISTLPKLTVLNATSIR